MKFFFQMEQIFILEYKIYKFFIKRTKTMKILLIKNRVEIKEKFVKLKKIKQQLFILFIYLFLGEADNSYLWTFYLLFHSHFSQILHTISILLTVTLAVWRYIAIK